LKYIFFLHDNIEYWIEIHNEGYALRQIISNNGMIQISCKTDCLAEGSINVFDLDGECKYIDYNTFEKKWQSIIKIYKVSWMKEKKVNSVGKVIQGNVKYFYPQGVILQIDDSQAICDYNELKKVAGSNNLKVGQIVNGVVIGYDESNMWIKVTPL